MSRGIDGDLQRFNEIVRGKVRQNLRKYVTHGEMLGRKGGETVSIPVPNIEIPHFKHGPKGSGGTGQGEGEVGQSVGQGGQGEEGQGSAGDQPGGHIREVEMSLDELALILGNELELPNIEPRGSNTIKSVKDRYSSIRTTGPNSLRHFKRTYKQALKRQIASKDHDLINPRVIPTKEDERFRSWKTIEEPQTNAAIIYMMDVSGSMADEQKEIVRTTSFWIDTWLRSQYRDINRRYIVHDAVAHEVDEDTFYRIRESGGTRISSAYKLAEKIIAQNYPVSDWNLYIFQFSDGDNWGEDNRECLTMLTEKLVPHCNLFCYGQVDSPYGSGDYFRELKKITEEHEKITIAEIDNKDAIYDCIKTFLGKGK
jgi:hypothetical protein